MIHPALAAPARAGLVRRFSAAAACAWLAVAPSAGAQPLADTAAPAPASPALAADAGGLRWQWSASVGAQHYREPAVDVELQGPEVGVHLRLSDPVRWPRWQAEADVLAGLQRYDSNGSGVLRSAENVETRWRLLYQAWQRPGGGLFIGPALHTHYSDLRGRTSLNASGYERENIGLWLAAQWRQPLRLSGALSSLEGLQLDAGRLVQARHTSFLSQVGPGYDDVENTQRQGWYGQARLSFKAQGLLLQPFVRYTHVKDSNFVPARFGPQGVRLLYEPENDRWQAGLLVSWPAR